MSYQIVKFQNGTYGIRKRNIFQSIFNLGGTYYDFQTYSIKFRPLTELWIFNIQSTSFEETIKAYLQLEKDFIIELNE